MSTIINATTTNGVVIQPDNSGSLELQTNSGTTAVTINTSQNVGIGTTSPNLSGLGTTNTCVTIRGNSSTGRGAIELANNGTSADGQGLGDVYFYDASNLNARISAIRDSSTTTAYLRFLTNGGSGVTERMRIDSSGNLLFNSGYGSVATAYGCRAWVNFNGTGTVAIRASGNVSSITDGGVGIYTINFTTAMPDADYSAVCTSTSSATAGGDFAYVSAIASGSFTMRTEDANGAVLNDVAFNFASVFR